MIQLSWHTAQASGFGLLTAAALIGPSFTSANQAQAQSAGQTALSYEAPGLSTVQGELLPPEAIGTTIVEGWDEVFAREVREPLTVYDSRRRSGAQGTWIVPSIRRSGRAHSGLHYASNKWGDARMGLGFGALVDVRGAWILGQGDASTWPASLVVVGFRAGVEVRRSGAFTSFSAEAAWFGMDLSGVDRIEFHVDPRAGTTGQFGVDDLTYVADSAQVVLDFEDKNYEDKLSGSGYAGLSWEVGTGDFGAADVIHAPLTQDTDLARRDDEHLTLGGSGTAPTLQSSFIGPGLGSASGASYVPPDTCGAVGPAHFVSVVNSNISVYLKSTGVRVLNTNLNTFLAGASFGDPRVTYDTTSSRFIVLATEFGNEISVAISNTSDPTGAWTKSTFNPSQSTDAGKWPDYPTLGCNKDFIVTCAYMVGGANKMSIFAIDKMNFINTGSLTVTAFRGLPWEGAIHPATTYDATASQYLVSRASGLRIRRLNLPAGAPTLTELGIAATALGSAPPNAPQLGGPGLDTLDGRLMNAIWVGGDLWTTCCISSGGKAGCRWWQVDTASVTVAQTGTVDDASLYYFAPSIAANANGDVVMGFSGSNAAQYAAAYFTGRVATDAAGQMGVPVQYKAGEGPYNDGAGPRWGDYSLVSLDPTDDSIFWMLQEYARTGNNWGTYVAEVQHGGGSGCNVHNYCFTSPNSVGPGSLIFSTGSASIAANDFSVVSDSNPPNKNGIFFMGVNEILTPFGNGFLCLSGSLTRYNVVQTDVFGSVTMDVDNTVPPALGKIVSGSTWKWQFWYRDPAGGGAAFNLSDGLSVTYCP